MNKSSIILSVIILHLLFTENNLNAQVPILLSSQKHAIYTSFGIDPAFVITLGYARGFNVSTLNKNMMLSSEISVPIKLDINDYRIKLGGHMNIFSYRKLDCWGVLTFIEKNTKNSIHKANSLGIDITFLTGFYSKHYFITGELGYYRSFLTHIKHTSWYKTYFYADAKDGWYRNTASHFNYGFRTGFSLSKFGITLRAGVQKSKSIIDPLVPFYGVLEFNYRF